MGIKITIDSEGKILIKRKKKKKGNQTKSIVKPVQPTTPKPTMPTLIILRNIIDQMEIRAESVFRPNESDVETAYALSGGNIIDMLHKFTSKEVIREATPMVIYTVTENKIKHIIEEREEKPKIIVDVHTHPNGIAEPSDQDCDTFKKVAKIFKEKLPEVKIYFGIHAVSDEKFGKRCEPEVIGNRIKWRSITRKHEVAFFDENCKPIKVNIVKRGLYD